MHSRSTLFTGRRPVYSPSCQIPGGRPTPRARVTMAQAAKLHCPHEGSSGDALFDLLMGAAMQAQQVTNCFNNCLATSLAVVKSAEAIGAPGYSVVFGHLASSRTEVTSQIPHVWVEYKNQLIMDATLSDVMPTEDALNYKKQLTYTPGRAPNPMADVGLPTEASDQLKLEHFVNHPDEYLALLAAAPEDSAQARAYLLFISLTQGLGSAREELQQLIPKA